LTLVKTPNCILTANAAKAVLPSCELPPLCAPRSEQRARTGSLRSIQLQQTYGLIIPLSCGIICKDFQSFAECLDFFCARLETLLVSNLLILAVLFQRGQ